MAWIARFEGEFLLKLFTTEERKIYSARFQTDEFLRALWMLKELDGR